MKKDVLIYKQVLFRVMSQREYHDHIEDLLDSLSAEVLAVNRRGLVTVWNQRLAERVCPKEEALGQPLRRLIERITDPLRAVDIEELIHTHVMEKGESVYLDRYPQRDARGQPILYDIRIDPLRFVESREIYGAVLVRTDVTEKYLSSDREVRTARTSSLANLGASIAHEIRNPLNSIAVHFQLLREEILDRTDEDPDVVESVTMISEEIDRLNRVVDNFLRFSRMPEPELAPGDLNETVRRTVKLLGPEAENRGVELRFAPGDIPPVAHDADLLRQAVHNVLLNAVQASEPGGAVTVSTRKATHSVILEVADAGPGIPPAERERIFDLFYSGRSGGTGLGLPIANRIVEEHGGRISLGAAPSGGARFELHFPLREEEEP